MNIYEYIDYTLLKATATKKEIFDLCNEAIIKGCASVCIPSNFVYAVKEMYEEELTVCTVVGFPFGNSTLETKVAEARQAIKDGADEIDMVMDIGEFKSGNHYFLSREIDAIAEVMPKKAILKVIIETCYLTEEEIAIATKIVDESIADYVKTSTGFGTRGASFRDIDIMNAVICNGTKIKASGGIRTKEDMIKYLELGCDRIGASKLP